MRFIIIIYFLGWQFNITAQNVVPDHFYNNTPNYFDVFFSDESDIYHEFGFWFFKTPAFREWVVNNKIKCLIKLDEIEPQKVENEYGLSIREPMQFIAEYYFDEKGCLDSLVFKTKEINTYSRDALDNYLSNPIKYSEIPFEMTQSDKEKLRLYGGKSSLAGMRTKFMNYAIDTNGIMFADVLHNVHKTSGELAYTYSFRINAIYTFENEFRFSKTIYSYNGDFWDPWIKSSAFQQIEDDYSLIQNKHVIYRENDKYIYNNPIDTSYFINYYVHKSATLGYDEIGYRYFSGLNPYEYVPLIKNYTVDQNKGNYALNTDVYMSKKLYLKHYNYTWFMSMFEDYYLEPLDSIFLIQRETVNYNKNNKILSVKGYKVDFKGENLNLGFIEKRTKKGFERKTYDAKGKIKNTTIYECDKDGLLKIRLKEDSQEHILLGSTKDSLQAVDNQGRHWINFEIVYR